MQALDHPGAHLRAGSALATVAIWERSNKWKSLSCLTLPFRETNTEGKQTGRIGRHCNSHKGTLRGLLGTARLALCGQGWGGRRVHSRSVLLVQRCLVPVQGCGHHHLLAAHWGGRQGGTLQLQGVLFVPEVQKLPRERKDNMIISAYGFSRPTLGSLNFQGHHHGEKCRRSLSTGRKPACGAHTWEGEKGRVLTGVVLGVRLLQSRKDRLALLSVTGDSATRRFFCRLSTEGGVPMPVPPMSVLGEMGISSPRLLRLRSEMVWPSRRYSVTLDAGPAGWRGVSACGWDGARGCTGLLWMLPSAEGSSGRSNLLRSHQASGSCTEGGNAAATQLPSSMTVTLPTHL